LLISIVLVVFYRVSLGILPVVGRPILWLVEKFYVEPLSPKEESPVLPEDELASEQKQEISARDRKGHDFDEIDENYVERLAALFDRAKPALSNVCYNCGMSHCDGACFGRATSRETLHP